MKGIFQMNANPSIGSLERRNILRGGAGTVAAAALSGLAAGEARAQARPKAATGRHWPNGARLVISVSMQFESGAQSEHDNGSPFPPMDAKYPDLPARTWFEYGVREGIPRLLDLWDRHGVKVTSHMTGQAVERNPQLAREMLRVINISKLQNSYRLRLAKGTGTLEWLTTDGEKELILTAEPESDFFQRFYNMLIAPIVPEMLL